MKVPLSYSFRNLWTRRLTTILTARAWRWWSSSSRPSSCWPRACRQTLVETGSSDNVVVIRKGSRVGGPERHRAAPGLGRRDPARGRRGAGGRQMLAKEVVVLISLPKRGTDKPSNVIIRGVSEESLALRPQVKLMEGRMPRPGSSEIIVGESIAKRFTGRRDRRDAALRHAGLDRGRDLRRGQHRLQLRDLGRRGPAHAGLPAAGVLIGDLQACGTSGV